MTREDLKTLIAANRQALQFLDGQVKELNSLVNLNAAQEAEDEAKVRPFFYGVVDENDEPGISLNHSNDDDEVGLEDLHRFQGFVRIHEDAPFVWTGLLATMRQNVGDNRSQKFFRGIYAANSAIYMGGLQLGFTDVGAGRALFQAELGNENTGSGGDQLLAPSMYEVVQTYSGQQSYSDGGQREFGCNAPGHGPSDFFHLPSEMLLPSSGVIQVDAIPSFLYQQGDLTSTDDYRLFICLLGYKILGD